MVFQIIIKQNANYGLHPIFNILNCKESSDKKSANLLYNPLLLQTKFRIVELKNEENISEDKAYINITQNEMINSCHSPVGKAGYSQPLEIGGCRGWWMILHEFAHALGIFFSIS